jgi:hypothetical protein
MPQLLLPPLPPPPPPPVLAVPLFPASLLRFCLAATPLQSQSQAREQQAWATLLAWFLFVSPS